MAGVAPASKAGPADRLQFVEGEIRDTPCLEAIFQQAEAQGQRTPGLGLTPVGADEDDFVDEGEFVRRRDGRDAKRRSREAHGDWLRAKQDHEAAALAVEASKAALLDEFQAFFDAAQGAAAGSSGGGAILEPFLGGSFGGGSKPVSAFSSAGEPARRQPG